jgi:hypothetical protein
LEDLGDQPVADFRPPFCRMPILDSGQIVEGGLGEADPDNDHAAMAV